MNRRTLTSYLLLGAVALAAGACSKVGPQKRDTPPASGGNGLYEVDLSKPEGPMYQLLRAAQDRNQELFKASFAPTAAMSQFDDTAFKKIRTKVLSNKLAPVPQSVQQLSETEAIVKLRDARGREIPVRVQKFDGNWLITSIEITEKAKQRIREKKGGATT
jgi:hypothetical protein